MWFPYNCHLCIYATGNIEELSKINTFLEKRQYLPHYWPDKGFKGTVESRTLQSLHKRPLEFKLTVPLSLILIQYTYYTVQDVNICLYNVYNTNTRCIRLLSSFGISQTVKQDDQQIIILKLRKSKYFMQKLFNLQLFHGF